VKAVVVTEAPVGGRRGDAYFFRLDVGVVVQHLQAITRTDQEFRTNKLLATLEYEFFTLFLSFFYLLKVADVTSNLEF
jgi:hypothetical protein